MPSTVKTRDRIQVVVDGKDWLFPENGTTEDVPAEVLKALDSAGFKYETEADKKKGE